MMIKQSLPDLQLLSDFRMLDQRQRERQRRSAELRMQNDPRIAKQVVTEAEVVDLVLRRHDEREGGAQLQRLRTP